MGAARHLGIRLRDYDARIRTFIPRYEEMLDAAATALAKVGGHATSIVELGIGSGALAARSAAAAPAAHIIGIDNDTGMLALARRRLGTRLTAVPADFQSVPIPRCDVIMASFALHHIPTRRRKAAMYARCFAAIRPGGLLVNADCFLAADPQLQVADRAAWRAHLQRRHTRARAEQLLRAWAREDVYFRLIDEMEMLRTTGFAVDVLWRREGFAVIVAAKPSEARRVRRQP